MILPMIVLMFLGGVGKLGVMCLVWLNQGGSSECRNHSILRLKGEQLCLIISVHSLLVRGNICMVLFIFYTSM